MISWLTALILGLGSIITAGIGGGVSAYNQDQANKTNLEQQKLANDAAALEAQKNRDWQEQMSNTAHQREAADLEAAGFNKAVTFGGAPVGTGAVAQQNAASVKSLGDGGLSSMASSLQSLAFMSAINSGQRLNAAERRADAMALEQSRYEHALGRDSMRYAFGSQHAKDLQNYSLDRIEAQLRSKKNYQRWLKDLYNPRV